MCTRYLIRLHYMYSVHTLSDDTLVYPLTPPLMGVRVVGWRLLGTLALLLRTVDPLELLERTADLPAAVPTSPQFTISPVNYTATQGTPR